jgi:hypothetical protein
MSTSSSSASSSRTSSPAPSSYSDSRGSDPTAAMARLSTARTTGSYSQVRGDSGDRHHVSGRGRADRDAGDLPHNTFRRADPFSLTFRRDGSRVNPESQRTLDRRLVDDINYARQQSYQSSVGAGRSDSPGSSKRFSISVKSAGNFARGILD